MRTMADFFPAFNMSGYTPQPRESWVSSLFEPFGGLTPVGQAFFANCAEVNNAE